MFVFIKWYLFIYLLFTNFSKVKKKKVLSENNDENYMQKIGELEKKLDKNSNEDSTNKGILFSVVIVKTCKSFNFDLQNLPLCTT